MSGLIDVHSHFVTEDYVAAAVAAGHEHPDGMPRWATWSAADHLALMDRCGIATSVLSVSAPGTHFGDDAAARALTRRMNEFAAELVLRQPDRFAQFASLPLPDVPGAVAELAHALDTLGAAGVSVLTNVHGVYPGDERYAELHAELDRRGATVFVHPVAPPHREALAPSGPSPMMEYLFESARAAVDLVQSGLLVRYPDIDWVFPHSGGVLPLLVERVQMFADVFASGAAGPPVAGQLARLWFDTAGTPFPTAVPALVRAFGPDRLLYGSDYCWTPVPAVLRQVASLDAAEQPAGSTWRELTTANARRLLS